MADEEPPGADVRVAYCGRADPAGRVNGRTRPQFAGAKRRVAHHGARVRKTASGRHDLRHQSGRAAAPLRAGPLWTGALHVQRGHRPLLDSRDSAVDALLLAALSFLSPHGRGENGMVEQRIRAADRNVDREDLREQHDADGAARRRGRPCTRLASRAPVCRRATRVLCGAG